VRDGIAEVARGWMSLLAQSVADAQRTGELDASLERDQLAFELDAFMNLGNSLFLLDGADALERSRRSIADRLESART